MKSFDSCVQSKTVGSCVLHVWLSHTNTRSPYTLIPLSVTSLFFTLSPYISLFLYIFTSLSLNICHHVFLFFTIRELCGRTLCGLESMIVAHTHKARGNAYAIQDLPGERMALCATLAHYTSTHVRSTVGDVS